MKNAESGEICRSFLGEGGRYAMIPEKNCSCLSLSEGDSDGDFWEKDSDDWDSDDWEEYFSQDENPE